MSLCWAIVMLQLPWGGAGAMTGTMGNMLTLLALAIQPKFCTHFNLLIANLEVADLFYGTLF